jgi:hypothetical protein
LPILAPKRGSIIMGMWVLPR